MCNFKVLGGVLQAFMKSDGASEHTLLLGGSRLHQLSISLVFSFSVSRKHASAPLPRVSHLGVALGLPSLRCQVCPQTALPLTHCAPASLIHVFWLPILSASIKFPHNLVTAVQCLQNDARKRCSQLSHSASYLFFLFLTQHFLCSLPLYQSCVCV